MAALLQVAQIGHLILRRRAKPVTAVKSRSVQTLIDNLIATVMDVNGVGIAAPQVYQSVRLFIVASHPNTRYPDAPDMKPTAMINPVIISHSSQKEKDWEGCLSVPGIRGLVPRFTEITVTYTDRNGKKKKNIFNHFIARIIQHEHDHLEGIMFTDRLESSKDIISEKEYQRLRTKKSAV